MSDETPAGHPSRHGFVCCIRCGTWIRRGVSASVTDAGLEHHCRDTAWCSEQAKDSGRLAESPKQALPATIDPKRGSEHG